MNIGGDNMFGKLKGKVKVATIKEQVAKEMKENGKTLSEELIFSDQVEELFETAELAKVKE